MWDKKCLWRKEMIFDTFVIVKISFANAKRKGVSSALICWAFLLIHKVALCSYAIFQKNVKVHYIYKKGSFSVKLVNQPFTKRVRKYCSERRTMGSKFSKGRKRFLLSLFWSQRNLCNLRWLEYKDVSVRGDSKNSKPQHPLRRWEPFQLLQLPKM